MRPSWLLCASLAAAWLALRHRQAGWRTRHWLRAAAASTAAALLLPWSPAPVGLELHALDVGHGTAVVFRAPGESCWIFDCGSRDRIGAARSALAPLLRSWEVNSTKVVLSHADDDHARGLRWVIERCPPSLWVGALPAPLAERLAHTCPRLDLDQGRLELPGHSVGLRLALLRGAPIEGNEGSRSLWLSAASRGLLLCGDAVDEGWAGPLREGLPAGEGGLLLAPHHGSDGRRVAELLDAFAPASVWISGTGRPPIAAELERRGLAWHSTAVEGSLVFRVP
jgi:competence protein ComEC